MPILVEVRYFGYQCSCNKNYKSRILCGNFLKKIPFENGKVFPLQLNNHRFLYLLHFRFLEIVESGRGDTVVKILYYKSEGRWFDPKYCQWNFSLT